MAYILDIVRSCAETEMVVSVFTKEFELRLKNLYVFMVFVVLFRLCPF
jgi:hypothetical protein